MSSSMEATFKVATSRKDPGTIMWALVVGIDDYQVPEYCMKGALADIDNMYAYLTRDRRVSSGNIKILRNEEATRQAILCHIDEHLIKNPNIERDDPILFHFSGYGTSVPAPQSWLSQTPQIDCIVPYDSVTVDPASEGTPAGIPDRTLRAKLQQLAMAKGNNITVILDCCYPEHALRGSAEGWYSRGLAPQQVGQLFPDTDKAVWAAQNGSSTSSTSHDLDSNSVAVIFSAASRKQPAKSSANGGLLTHYLLNALRTSEQVLSNSELLEKTKELMHCFYNDWDASHNHLDSFERQEPHCLGVHKERPAFQTTPVERGSFSVRKLNTSQCQILAGQTAGVKIGTVFRLVSPINGLQEAKVVVTSVEPSSCTASLPENFDVGDTIQASLDNFIEPILVHIARPNVERDAATKIYSRLKQCFEIVNPQEAKWCKQVESAKDAEVLLEVVEDGVILKRKADTAQVFDTPSSKIYSEDINTVFPGIMKSVSLFNSYLTMGQTAAVRPRFASDVEVTLHRLKFNSDSQRQDDGLMVPDKQHNFNNQDEVVIHHEEGALYAVILHNSSSTDIYPYVVFFDPYTYGSQLFYEPRGNKPPLRRGEKLQLGRSEECKGAILFTLAPEQEKDVGFLKIILATEPIPDIKFMNLDPAFGYDEHNNPLFSYVRKGHPTQDQPKPLPGVWETLLRKVTIAR